MKILTESDSGQIRNVIDSGVKNKWNWNWLQHSVEVQLEKHGVKTFKLEAIFQKIDVPGKAWCTTCESEINYGSRGRVAMIDHVKGKSHIRKTDTVLSNHSIKAMLKDSSAAEEVNEPSQPSIRDVVKLPVPLFDRVSNAEVDIFNFSKICCLISV